MRRHLLRLIRHLLPGAVPLQYAHAGMLRIIMLLSFAARALMRQMRKATLLPLNFDIYAY